MVHEPMNVDPRRVNLVWIEFPRLDNDLRFGNGEFAARGCVRIEVSRGASVDEIPVEIGLPCLH